MESQDLQVYEVIDAYSEVFLGYSVCETENPRAQYAAYRMALITAGHRPYEVVHDNQGGHKEGDAVKFWIASRSRCTARPSLTAANQKPSRAYSTASRGNIWLKTNFLPA